MLRTGIAIFFACILFFAYLDHRDTRGAEGVDVAMNEGVGGHAMVGALPDEASPHSWGLLLVVGLVVLWGLMHAVTYPVESWVMRRRYPGCVPPG